MRNTPIIAMGAAFAVMASGAHAQEGEPDAPVTVTPPTQVASQADERVITVDPHNHNTLQADVELTPRLGSRFEYAVPQTLSTAARNLNVTPMPQNWNAVRLGEEGNIKLSVNIATWDDNRIRVDDGVYSTRLSNVPLLGDIPNAYYTDLAVNEDREYLYVSAEFANGMRINLGATLDLDGESALQYSPLRGSGIDTSREDFGGLVEFTFSPQR